jgi:hypothetical protein
MIGAQTAQSTHSVPAHLETGRAEAAQWPIPTERDNFDDAKRSSLTARNAAPTRDGAQMMASAPLTTSRAGITI